LKKTNSAEEGREAEGDTVPHVTKRTEERHKKALENFGSMLYGGLS